MLDHRIMWDTTFVQQARSTSMACRWPCFREFLQMCTARCSAQTATWTIESLRRFSASRLKKQMISMQCGLALSLQATYHCYPTFCQEWTIRRPTSTCAPRHMAAGSCRSQQLCMGKIIGLVTPQGCPQQPTIYLC